MRVNIIKMLTTFSSTQKIWFYLFTAVAVIFIWFTLISLFQNASNKNAMPSQEIITFNILECIDLSSNSPICDDREDALKAIKSFQEVRKEIVAINIELWSPDDYIVLQDLAAKADQLFRDDRFRLSQEVYGEAITLAQNFIGQARASLETLINDGYGLLLANNWLESEKLFRQALAINSTNIVAKIGLDRSLVLEQVLEHLNEASLLIKINSFDQAKEMITKASILDNENLQSKEAIIKINELIQNREISLALAKGYDLLSNDHHSGAINYFKKVLLIDAQSQAAHRGIEEAAEGIMKETILSERKLAEQSFEAENFPQSLIHYTNIINLRDNMEFAVAGSANIKSFIVLEKKINRYLDSPTRLSSRAVFEEASKVLQSTISYNLRARLLAKKIELTKLLDLYAQSITLKISSDNRTNISILNTGNLGTFNSTELNLSLGVYTFIGKRKGYVTVRKVIDLSESTSINIECNNKIL